MPSAIAIKKIDGKPGKVYYPLEKITIPTPQPKDNEVNTPHLSFTTPSNPNRPSYPSPPPPSTTATSLSANTYTPAQPSASLSSQMASAS
jgi:hypothetical protein